MSDQLGVEIVGRHLRTAPVDVRQIASALGLRVREARLPPSISGKIQRHPMGLGYVVTVNDSHPEVRKRFTIAHEIAHFILHRDLIGDGIVDNALYRDARLGDSLERQANNYAAAILMPPNLVQRKRMIGKLSPKDLAREFQVSEAVAAIRLQELGVN
jgi:Zn-dependent peptidase ImmA (M78 family)